MDQVLLGATTNNLPQATTEYNFLFGSMGRDWDSTQNQRRNMCSAAGTLKELRIFLTGSPGTGNSYVFTVYKNGSPTSLTVTISDAETTGVDAVNSVAVVAGDTLSLEVNPNSSPTIRDASWSCIFDSTSSNSSILSAGNTDQPATGATEYTGVGAGSTWSTSIPDAKGVIPIAGTLKNMYVKLLTAPDTGKSYTFTLVLNGVDQDLEVAVADLDTTGNDTADDIAVSAGDVVYIKCVPSGTPDASYVQIGMEFAPTTNGNSIHMGGTSDDLPSFTQFNYMYPSGQGIVWATSSNSLKPPLPECTVKNLYFEIEDPVGGSYDFDIEINTSDTAVDLNIAGGNTTGNSGANTVSINAGELINIQAKANNPTIRGESRWGLVTFIAAEVDVIVTPSEQSLTLSLEAPVISVDASISPNELGLTLSLESPVISGDSIISPNELSLSLSLETPIVSGDANVLPNELSLSLSLETPVISGDSIISPDALSLSLSLEASTIITEGSIFVSPDTLALTTSLEAPTIAIEISVIVSPSELGLTLSLLAPTIIEGGSVTVSPSTLETNLSLKDPTIIEEINIIVSPNTLEITTSLETPSIEVIVIRLPLSVSLSYPVYSTAIIKDIYSVSISIDTYSTEIT